MRGDILKNSNLKKDLEKKEEIKFKFSRCLMALPV